ncbi:hypothetical protein AB0K53_01200 [Streptomyces tuirus]|uniref:hypothetical protein n=1 Tax=Streptomyces tuirus TaxID=68278 RepID=UPI00343FB0DC
MTNLALAALLIGTTGAGYCACRVIALLFGEDQRTRNDRAAARRILRHNPPTEQQAPGTDHDLLLDAHLAYHGPTAARKETQQP